MIAYDRLSPPQQLTPLRDLKRIPQVDRGTIVSAITTYADTGRGDVRALKDQPGFRLRVGDWRVIFDITAA